MISWSGFSEAPAYAQSTTTPADTSSVTTDAADKTTSTQFAASLSDSDQTFFQRLAKRVESDLQGKPSRLNQYVEFYNHELANDDRLFAFQVTATQTGESEALVLEGYVEFAQHRFGVEALLRTLGFAPIDNRIELLPEASLKDKAFAVVTAPRSLSYTSSDEDHSVGTELLFGETLLLLKEEGDYFLCHSGGGYLGFVTARDVIRLTKDEFSNYAGRKTLVVQNPITIGDMRLPVGARLAMLGENEQDYEIQQPDGQTVRIEKSADVVRPKDVTADLDAMEATAKSFLGTKYFWGGKSQQGIDCSGLVQMAYFSAGFHLPRDSNQQVYLGRLTGTRWITSTLQRGDTLYFLGRRGRIRHTALYLGDGRYIEAVSPVVKITSLRPDDPLYDEARHKSFAFGKRLVE